MEWVGVAIMVAASVGIGFACFHWGRARGVDVGRVEQFEVQRAELERVRAERAEALEELARLRQNLGVGKEAKQWLKRWGPS